MTKLSVVVPCYNEEAVIDSFDVEIRRVLDSLPVEYEVCYVDDGSRDGPSPSSARSPPNTVTVPGTSPSAATSARRPACSPVCARPPATPS